MTLGIFHVYFGKSMVSCLARFRKLMAFPAASVVALLLPSGQQNQSPPSQPSNAPQVREEIRTIEKLLPQLLDRGPALSQLAHDYVYLGDLSKGLSVLKECIALKEGFDPDGDPVFLPLKTNPEYVSLVSEVHREYPQVQQSHLAARGRSDLLTLQ